MACEAKQELTAKVELKVNDEEIELNKFAQNFIARTVSGMVESLRGVGEIKAVKLTIENLK